MKLNELIKEESIDNVSVVTNISPDNLTALVNEDFSKLGPASASRFILWGNSKIISENLKSYLSRFNIGYNIK